MTTHFLEDQFGLSHAVALHPREPRAVRLMVLQADNGWWAYVDGDRLLKTFRTKRQAQSAARREVRSLARPRFDTPEHIPARTNRRPKPWVGAAAPFVVVLSLAVTTWPTPAHHRPPIPAQDIQAAAISTRTPNAFPFLAIDTKRSAEISPVRHHHPETLWQPAKLGPLKQASRRIARTNKRKTRRRKTVATTKQNMIWGRDIPMPARD